MRSRFVTTAFCLLAMSLAGCPSGVREDRTIQTAAHTDTVAFGHGRKGVFLHEAGQLRKIFQGEETVVATSAPLFAPSDERAIFCTAEALVSTKAVPVDDWDASPQGRIYHEQPARYTCRLREPQSQEDEPEQHPRAIFTATCGHAGYVAANLAVRWRADGDAIWYIEQTDAGRHRLMQFDLASGNSEAIDAPVADMIAFDISPDGSTMVCAVASRQPNPFLDGLWVKQIPDGVWWHVDGSQQLNSASFSMLNNLQAALPVWRPKQELDVSNLQSDFVYLRREQRDNDDTRAHVLSLVNMRSQSSSEMLRETAMVQDIHWHPSGEYLAFVRADTSSSERSLHALSLAGDVSLPLSQMPVRRFAGWDSKGDRFAFTSSGGLENAGEERPSWSLLLRGDPNARDRVFVGTPADERPHEVFAGMRVTFPAWSMRDDRLTLWATFTPNYRLAFPWGMPGGDPAAILDPATGEIEWMTVDAREQLQVGHWHLLHKRYAEAQLWYAEAQEAKTSGDVPITNEDSTTLEAATDCLLQAICLDKIGRAADAQAKRDAFDQFLRPQQENRLGEDDVPPITPEDEYEARLVLELLRSFLAAQAYLSVNAAVDGKSALRGSVTSADTLTERLGAALALSQLLLIDEEYEDYAALCTEVIAPAVAESLNAQVMEPDALVAQRPSTLVVGTALWPLFQSEFLSQLPRRQRVEMVTAWSAIREEGTNECVLVGCDLFLLAAYQADGDTEYAALLRQKLDNHPEALRLFSEDGRALWNLFAPR